MEEEKRTGAVDGGFVYFHGVADIRALLPHRAVGEIRLDDKEGVANGGDNMPDVGDEKGEASEDEPTLILQADAVIHPSAMMIHDGDAFIAIAAMLGAQGSSHETRIAERRRLQRLFRLCECAHL